MPGTQCSQIGDVQDSTGPTSETRKPRGRTGCDTVNPDTRQDMMKTLKEIQANYCGHSEENVLLVVG